jgi:hypothetical protein
MHYKGEKLDSQILIHASAENDTGDLKHCTHQDFCKLTEPPAQNGWLRKRDKKPLPSVKTRIDTRPIVVTITTDDGTFVVSIPKLG